MVPVNNSHVRHVSFLATDTPLCVLIYNKIHKPEDRNKVQHCIFDASFEDKGGSTPSFEAKPVKFFDY